MTPREAVVVHPDAAALAAGIAARMAIRLMDVLAEQECAHLVLTGGTTGTAGLAALRDQPALHAVDFSRVHVWWGDERYVPRGDADRNDAQAQAAMRGAVAIPPTHLHTMPALGEDASAEEAGQRYAEELASFAPSGKSVPEFDLLLLGVGPEGHVASLFPDHPATRATASGVVAVHDSPKPPPTRLSLTMPAIRTAKQVWLLAAGEGKVDGVRIAWLGAKDVAACPAAMARGTEETLLLIDAAASAGLHR